MRFDRINLIAFGPFSHGCCELPARDHDFHVLHGPNEAGKSSLLRAIAALLYGIEKETRDAFRFNYDQLRLGATVRLGNQTLEFQRRKGTKNTLLAGDGLSPLAEDALKPFLQGVDLPRFCNLYGLDRSGLAEGGRAISSGRGDIASALFEAGGLQGVRKLVAAIQGEADGIFAPQAPTKPLNRAVAAYRDAESRKHKVTVTVAREKELRGARDQAAARLEKIRQGLDSTREQLARLQRIRDNLGDLGRLQMLRTQFARVSTAQLLDTDASQRRVEAQTALDDAQSQIIRIEQSLKERRARVDGLKLRPKVVENKQEIDRLYRGVGRYQKDASDISDLKRRVQTQEEEIRRCLAQKLPGVDEQAAAALVPVLSQASTVRSLLLENSRLVKAEEQDQENSEKFRRLVCELARLPEPRGAGPLVAALEQIQTRGDLEQRLREEEAELKQLEAEVSELVDALPGWDGTAEELARQACPVPETLRLHAGHIDQSESGLRQATDRRVDCEREAKQARAALEQQEQNMTAPSQASLIAARLSRDELWSAIEGLAFRKTVSLYEARAKAGAADVAAEYSRRVGQADKVSDERFAAAGHLSEVGARKAEAERKDGRLADAQKAEQGAQDQLDLATQQWRTAWPPPLPQFMPAQAKEWAAQRTAILEKRRQASRKRTGLETLKEEIQKHRAELGSLLTGLGEPDAGTSESLATLLQRSKDVCARLQLQATRRSQKQHEIDLAQEACAASAANARERESWNRRWVATAGAFQLLSLTVENAEDRIPALEEYSRIANERDSLSSRVQHVQENIKCFEQEAKSLSLRCDSQSTLAAGDLIKVLHHQLEASEAAALSESSEGGEIAREEDELHRCTSRSMELEEELRRLCEAAGVADTSRLPEAEEQSAERRKLSSEIETLEQSLSARNGARTLAQVEKEAAGFDTDQLSREITRAEGDCRDLECQRDEAVRAADRALRDWEDLSGSQGAAEAAQQAAVNSEQIRVYTREYVRLKLCAEALRRGMEAYRQQHQTPVLESAGKTFSRMTLNEYVRLEQDYGKNDATVLKVVRSKSNGGLEHRALSEGTADQLFLALRLAIIDAHRGPQGGMPLILDEILESADEQRAAAILRELTQFSARNQVLLFTHHEHIADLAVRNGAGRVTMPFPIASAASQPG